MRSQEFITERWFNAFDPDEKQQYADVIWDMLQRSYAPIGGIHGSGFNNIEDMIQNNQMFKIGLSGGKPVMVSIYKNKSGGRKKVAMGTDGSEAGIAMAREAIKAEFTTGRAYGEISGPVFGAVKKMIAPEILSGFLVPANNVAALLNKEITIGAGPDMRISGAEHDPYTQFYYQRMIGGELHTKVAYGDPKRLAKFYNQK